MEDIHDTRKEILVEVAKLYYIDNLSQMEISNILHMSRSNISRLLKTCINNNIVEIKINDALSKAPELAADIKNKFHLKEVLIATTNNDSEKCRESVGALTAVYLNRILNNGMLFGFSWGRTTYYVAQHINFSSAININVIQLLGGISNKIMIDDGQELAKIFSSKFNGTSYIIQAPLMVKSKQLKDLLMQELVISDVISKFNQVDVALLNIGSPKLHINTQLPDEMLSRADILQLMEQGAVAQICGRYFDVNGMPCNAGINERVIGIDLEQLKKIPLTIGMAAGIEKLKATLSVLRSGCLNVLVVDEMLARSLRSYFK